MIFYKADALPVQQYQSTEGQSQMMFAYPDGIRRNGANNKHKICTIL